MASSSPVIGITTHRDEATGHEIDYELHADRTITLLRERPAPVVRQWEPPGQRRRAWGGRRRRR